jgi:hypothetical protein
LVAPSAGLVFSERSQLMMPMTIVSRCPLVHRYRNAIP